MENLFVLIFILSFTKIKCQVYEPLPRRPEKCHINTEVIYEPCCVFPPFFIRTVAKDCGAIFEVKKLDQKSVDSKIPVIVMRRGYEDHCIFFRCVLRKYHMLDDEDYVNDVKYLAHLDKWVELNPLFTDVMLNAKMSCKQNYNHYFPLKDCEFVQFHKCIRNFINVNCPIVINTPICLQQKQFYSNCKTFFT